MFHLFMLVCAALCLVAAAESEELESYFLTVCIRLTEDGDAVRRPSGGLSSSGLSLNRSRCRTSGQSSSLHDCRLIDEQSACRRVSERIPLVRGTNVNQKFPSVHEKVHD